MIQQHPVPPLFETVFRQVKTTIALAPLTTHPWGVDYWARGAGWTPNLSNAQTFTCRQDAEAWLSERKYLGGFNIVEVPNV